MLADVPMVFILVGITAYTVLSGADFGAGLWTLIPGGGRAGVAATRDHTRHSIGPVWEANHVWLIFVLTVAWTCYPVAFGSIVSTLSIPLFIAAVGIIFRGAMYALRSQLSGRTRAVVVVEDVFALSSVLTPFALATVIGGIATGRVPVGNARGNLVTSWLNPVSILAGVLAVAFSGYLAAVYLAADAHRLTERTLVRDFRARALVTGVLAGALALAGLFVVRLSWPRSLWDGLTGGLGLALVCVSALAGVMTLVLVFFDRFALARASAALGVAAVIAGWAAAQQPRLLPGLTVAAAAADRTTLIATIIGVAAGALVLVPSLLLLYTLVLRGRLDTGGTDMAEEAADGSGSLGSFRRRVSRGRLAGALAVVTFIAGIWLIVFAGPTWAHGLGALAMAGCAVIVFGLAAGPPEKTVAGPPEET